MNANDFHRFNAATIRTRPGMFVGSTSIAGVYALIFSFIEDIMHNSKQENILIRMELVEKDTCVLECEMFDPAYWLDDTETYHPALCLKIVKALSDRCELHINNERLLYQKGVLVSRNHIATDTCLDNVKIRFRPDKELFSYEEIEYYKLFNRMKELAQLNQAVSFHLKDESNENLLQFSGGLRVILRENTESIYVYTEPVNLEFIEEDIEVSVSMSFGYAADAKLSYVNNIRTYDGGAHEQGLYDGICAAFEKYIKNHMDKTMVLMKKQILKSLNFVIQVRMAHPPYQGAVKRGLGSKKVYLAVKNGVGRHLYPILESDQSFLEGSMAICEADLLETLWSEEDTTCS